MYFLYYVKYDCEYREIMNRIEFSSICRACQASLVTLAMRQNQQTAV